MNKVKPGGSRPPGRRTAAWAATSLLAVGGLALAGGQHALADSGADPSCVNGTCTVTLASPGTGQSFAVPEGVSSLSVTLYGGVGGSTNQVVENEESSEIFAPLGAPGGDGAEVTADVDVTPGETLGVDVGGAASVSTDAGGANGGGAGADGAPGGGATDVTSNGADLLVAGGGGGAAWGVPYADLSQEIWGGFSGSCVDQPALDGGAGGNADSPGGTGQAYYDGYLTMGGGGGGAQGTVTGPGAGGVGGVSSGTNDCGALQDLTGLEGNPGSGGTGGAALWFDIDSPIGGGGGGGGYFGGGSGGGPSNDDYFSGAAGGGGGGASYLAPAGSTTDTVIDGTIDDTGNSGQVNGGNGEAVISYADPVSIGSAAYTTGAGQQLNVDAASGLLSQSAVQAPAGDALSISGPASGQSAQGGTVTVNDDGSFSYTPPSATFTGSDSFSYTITDPYGDYATGTATINVQAPQAISFTAPSTGTAGQSATLTATGGGSGNPVIFTVDPSSGAGVCSVSGDTVSYSAAGTCVIDANQAGDGAYEAASPVTGTIQVQAAEVGPAFTADAPPLTAATGTAYSYQFTASGTPAATYALGGSAPSWLSVNATTGQVQGTPPAGTKSFSYTVIAANAAGSVTAGPFKVTVSPDADIRAGLSCPSGLTVGQTGTCTLTVTNVGPALATTVVAGAAVPLELKVTACSPSCSQLGGVLGWWIGNLPAGQSDSLTFTVTAVKTGTAIVAAGDGSANPDPNPFNNVAAATVKITK